MLGASQGGIKLIGQRRDRGESILKLERAERAPRLGHAPRLSRDAPELLSPGHPDSPGSG